MLIRNKQTGETKEVNESELLNYGISQDQVASAIPTGTPQYQQPNQPLFDVSKMEIPELEKGYIQTPEPFSAKQWGKYTAEEGGRMLKGITKLPEVAMLLGKTAIQNPSEFAFDVVPQVAKAVVKGAVADVYQTVRHPLRSAYTRPISTALDVVTIAKAISMAKKAFQGAKAVTSTTTELTKEGVKNPSVATGLADPDNAENMDDLTKMTERFNRMARPATETMDKTQTLEARTLESMWKLNAGERRIFNPNQAAEFATKYSLPVDPDQSMKKSEEAIRILNAVVNDSVGRVNAPVDPQMAVVSIMNSAPFQGVKKADAIEVVATMRDFLKSHPTDPQAITADNAIDTIKQMQGIARNLATKPYGSPARDLSKLYYAGAQGLQEGLDNAAKKTVNLNQYKAIPEITQRLAAISPEYADDVMKIPWTIGNVRSAMAPWVKLKLINERHLANMTSFFAGQQNRLLSGATRATIGGLAGLRYGGVLPALGGAILAPIIMPQMEKIAVTKGPQIAMSVARKLEKLAPIVNPVLSGIGAGVKTAKTLSGPAKTFAILQALKQLIPLSENLQKGELNTGVTKAEPMPGTAEYYAPH